MCKNNHWPELLFGHRAGAQIEKLFSHTLKALLKIKNSKYKSDFSPIEENCQCPVCSPEKHGFNHPFYSRAYIHHLQKINEMLGSILATQHNIWFYLKIMQEMRAAIKEKTFSSWRKLFLETRSMTI